MCLCRHRSPVHVWRVMTSMIDLLLIAAFVRFKRYKLLKTFHILRIVMETLAMVMLALVSVYGLVRFIQDVRDYLSKRATQPVTPTPNTKTKQCQGPTTYTRKNTKPKYEVLKDREFGAWGPIIW